jgi:hypothetical protein
MPVAPTFWGYFQREEAEHEDFAAVVSDVIREAGNIFVPAPPEDLFPVRGRSDRVHLNKYGAPIFSRYLGEQLGELTNEGLLDLSGEGGGE